MDRLTMIRPMKPLNYPRDMEHNALTEFNMCRDSKYDQKYDQKLS